MEEVEIWKDIPGYEGLYQASNLGQLKSLDRPLSKKRGRVLKQSDKGNGYKKVALHDINSVQKTHSVHRLIALTFLGFSIDVADHIDGNKSNNRLDNLRYVSSRKNSSTYQKNTTSIFTGVHWEKRVSKWKASIRILQKRYTIGFFESESEASIAYQQALYTWENYSINPKGIKLEKQETKMFDGSIRKPKNRTSKIVLDTSIGIFYKSLRESYETYCHPFSYRSLSGMLMNDFPNKTNLIYV